MAQTRKGGKRIRRTRQQILLDEEAALTNRAPKIVAEDIRTKMQSRFASESPRSESGNAVGLLGSNVNQKKSLRLLFQDAKKGKLGESKKMNFRYPRTVEAAKSPYDDPSGKNKWFFVIALGLFPDSKIVQPSDSESDTDAVYEPARGKNDDDGKLKARYDLYSDIHDAAIAAASASMMNSYDPDEAFMNDRTPSPVSPKVRRGRRPNNARRIPYGRAADIDHSWRSNYSRARRTVRRPGKHQLKDPQLIQDVINAVIQRAVDSYYSQGTPNRSRPENSNDTNNNDLNTGFDSHNNYSVANWQNWENVQTTPDQGNVAYIKNEVASSFDSSEEDGFQDISFHDSDDEEEDDDEDVDVLHDV